MSAEKTEPRGSITGSEVEYTDEELVFLKAVERYKREKNRKFPTYSEILAIAHSLGYRKVAEAGPLPAVWGESQ